MSINQLISSDAEGGSYPYSKPQNASSNGYSDNSYDGPPSVKREVITIDDDNESIATVTEAERSTAKMQVESLGDPMTKRETSPGPEPSAEQTPQEHLQQEPSSRPGGNGLLVVRVIATWSGADKLEFDYNSLSYRS